MTQYYITHLGRQGDGVADGPVYVARALPGETVTGDLLGDIVLAPKILQPSGNRVKPPCAHFKSCGGCQMQHASDGLVAEWKTSLIRTALDLNGVSTVIQPILTSPAGSRRRAKFAARRTKAGAIAGFHGKSSHDVVDVRSCPLTTPALDIGPELARALAVAGTSRKGELSVQITDTLDGLDVAVSGGKPLDTSLERALPPLMEKFRVARLTWNAELVGQIATPRVRLGQAQVRLPSGAFLQATEHGERSLQACVQKAVGDATSAVDLFAGCGTFALSLAALMPVHAVENDAAMLEALQAAANYAGLTYPVTTQTRDLFNNPLLPDELQKFDAVVLDPPRAGAVSQVAQLAKSGIRTIAYVSCDPGSFARDVAVLCDAGYCLDWVQPVDQFRWSPHVELAARLTLPHMTR